MERGQDQNSIALLKKQVAKLPPMSEEARRRIENLAEMTTCTKFKQILFAFMKTEDRVFDKLPLPDGQKEEIRAERYKIFIEWISDLPPVIDSRYIYEKKEQVISSRVASNQLRLIK